jgi:hypothetical protein
LRNSEIEELRAHEFGIGNAECGKRKKKDRGIQKLRTSGI